MADAKISALTDGGTVQATDEVPVNRAGANVKVSGLVAGGGSVPHARVAGRYYGLVPATNDATRVATASQVFYCPFPVYEAFSINSIGIGVSSAGGSGSVVRLGLYADSSGVPGSLITDYGTIDGTSATYQEITISTSLTAATLYWVAVVWQGGTAGSVRAIGVGDGSEWISLGALSQETRSSVFFESGVAGALPGTATPSSTPINTPPAVKVRVA